MQTSQPYLNAKCTRNFRMRVASAQGSGKSHKHGACGCKPSSGNICSGLHKIDRQGVLGFLIMHEP
eukprot:1159014-Pelagomonas_calceolata.AAC.5